MALLEADVSYKVAKDVSARRFLLRAMGQEVMESLTPAQQVVKIVNEELTALMGGEEARVSTSKTRARRSSCCAACRATARLRMPQSSPNIMSNRAAAQCPMACDIYRPAAIDQLQVVGEKARVPVFTMGTEKPPSSRRSACPRA